VLVLLFILALLTKRNKQFIEKSVVEEPLFCFSIRQEQEVICMNHHILQGIDICSFVDWNREETL